MSSSDGRSSHDRRAGEGLYLTPREREVLPLVLRGEQNKEIASKLGLSEQSVKQHVSDLLRKFGVPNRAALGEAGAHLDLVGPALLERSWFPQLFRYASVQIAVSRGPNHLYVAVNAAFANAVGRDVVGQTMARPSPSSRSAGTSRSPTASTRLASRSLPTRRLRSGIAVRARSSRTPMRCCKRCGAKTVQSRGSSSLA